MSTSHALRYHSAHTFLQSIPQLKHNNEPTKRHKTLNTTNHTHQTKPTSNTKQTRARSKSQPTENLYSYNYRELSHCAGRPPGSINRNENLQDRTTSEGEIDFRGEAKGKSPFECLIERITNMIGQYARGTKGECRVQRVNIPIRWRNTRGRGSLETLLTLPTSTTMPRSKGGRVGNRSVKGCVGILLIPYVHPRTPRCSRHGPTLTRHGARYGLARSLSLVAIGNHLE